MDDTQLKREIQKLVDEFRANYEKYSKEAEANIETKFVEPLFRLLGWTERDFEKQTRATRGDKRGRPDYEFKISDRIAFYLEAKKASIPLDKEADKQVISYALSKRIPFAVSTNFKELKIFCVEQEDALKNVFRVFKQPEDYLANLSDLKFLSKESFEKGLTLKKAEDEGRLKKRVTIDQTLLDDLMRIRSLIASDIEKTYPQKYELNEKDEIVQRIIDRLIFIRRCEDIGINPDNCTLEEIKHLPDNKAYPKLKEIFKTYNDVYNSGLFAIGVDNDCDKISIDGSIIKKLAYYLYESKDGSYVYNFDWIDADVLGQVYEQYLGKILAQTKSGKAKLKDGQAHKKEQGIFYTPTFVVDYIVKNTVGERLTDKKIDLESLKVLDPACGSGSFLIKAFDYFYNASMNISDFKQKKIDSQGAYSFKTQILKNNIYGLDLDVKAVEITKLNLLLKAAEKGRRLPPEANLHIRHGNSLIDEEKIAGLNAFKWIDEFADGSFDAVIGNPPWVRAKIACSKEELEFLKKKYADYFAGELNLYKLFIVESLKKLKQGGLFSFIVPSSYLSDRDSMPFRKWLLDKFSIKQIVVFSEKATKEMFNITQATTILVIKNAVPAKDSSINISELIDNNIEDFKKNHIKFAKITRNVIDKLPDYQIPAGKKSEEINVIVKLASLPTLSQIVDTKDGEIHLTKYKSYIKDSSSKSSALLVRGNHIMRYHINLNPEARAGGWIETTGLKVGTDIMKHKRILIQQVSNMSQKTRVKGAIVEPGIYAGNSCVSVISKDNAFTLEAILAILNSKLLNWYFRFFSSTNHVTGREVKNLPYTPELKNLAPKIHTFAERLLVLNSRLKNIGEKKTTEYAKIDADIIQISAELDKLLYAAYSLSEKEIAIIESES